MFAFRRFLACLLMAGSVVPPALGQTDTPSVYTPSFATPPAPVPPGIAPGGADPSSAPAPGPVWLDRGTALVQVLDKVNARHAVLDVHVGSSAQYGSLTIEVQSCMVRPPTQAADAAAFLAITDAHEGEPGFRGWMFASDPSVSMLEHPVYDVRVLGCQP